MLPTTPEYFCFLVLVFFAYWLLVRVRVAGLALICVANYFFYAKWGFIYLLLVPTASTVDYLIGRLLAKTNSLALRRLLLGVSVCSNVGLIISCKYVPLFAGAFGHWTGTPIHVEGWVLPLGLSFYAFQAMTYTFDVYRRDTKPITNYLAYIASVSFFPTTLAGPITRVAALSPQWLKRVRLTDEDGGRALFLIGLGLFKKFLIADYLGENLVNRVFDLPTLYSGGDVLVAVYAYAFQLYYDFSGYTDIAIGSALLLGIKLPINFNGPYKAQNIADFWRRWHISLSNWLRDYLYFSFPGKRTKVGPYIAIVITFAIGGLWHGANWTFLVWGFLHGLGLAIFRGWQAIRGNRNRVGSRWGRAAGIIVTFHFILFAWIFFRASSIDTALQILSQIASLKYSFDNTHANFLLVLAIGAAAHWTPKNWYDHSVHWFSRQPVYVQAAALTVVAFTIQYVASTGAAPFIYTKF